jgi:L-ascorbate metabolism protein UlaG (beta-lactamase superfamily)
MRLQLIRSATIKLTYAGHTLLVDPYFAPKHSRPSFANRSPNPLVDLPLPVDDILTGVELVLVSHLHSDHFDPTAQEALPKDTPILCQPGDAPAIHKVGFSQVTPLDDTTEWHGIRISRTGGRHGLGEVEAIMGPVSGFVLAAPGEPTLYFAGDTVMCDRVEAALARFSPDVIVTHSAGATWPDSSGMTQLIVMDAEQTLAVCRRAPRSLVVAVHLDSLDHGTVSREDLRQRAAAAGIGGERLRIPTDGEALEIGKAD